MKFTINNYFKAHQSLFSRIDKNQIEVAIKLVKKKFITKSKIITCGNGGSAYTASHFITDWNKMTNIYKKKFFYGFSLTDNVGLVTAYANDINYEKIFEGQLMSILNKNDLLIAISGSGNSKNVLNAVKYCNAIGATSLSFTGFDGGKIKKESKYNVHVPSFDMQICEDMHLMIGHMIMKNLCDINIKI